MGVRFACHACGKHLNIKRELAGRRGICPSCSTRFRIPLQDTQRSIPIEQEAAAVQSSGSAATHSASPVAAASSDVATSPGTATAPGIHASSAVATGRANSLDLLHGDADATWYVRPPTGGQYGPATGQVLQQWIGEGRVASTALLWRDGWPQWREASEALPDLTAQLAAAPSDVTAAQVNGSSQASGSPGTAEPVTAQPDSQPQSRPVAAVTAAQPATVVPQLETVPAATADTFGYEDSDFAGGSAYTSIKTEAPRLTGRDDVGSQRRNRSSKRTLSIVLLGLIALLLVAAIVFLVTR